MGRLTDADRKTISKLRALCEHERRSAYGAGQHEIGHEWADAIAFLDRLLPQPLGRWAAFSSDGLVDNRPPDWERLRAQCSDDCRPIPALKEGHREVTADDMRSLAVLQEPVCDD